nr:hypothetical protein [Angustibacter aerolatus]
MVRGTPSPEEPRRRRGGARRPRRRPEPARAPRPQWSDPSRTLRGGVAPSRGGWRASALPDR